MTPRNFITAVCFTAALTVGTTVFAQAPAAPPAGGPPQMATIRAAVESCRSSVAKDAQGHPDRDAMRACMSSKGFGPPGGAPAGAPPANSTAHISGPVQMAPTPGATPSAPVAPTTPAAH